MGFKTSAVPSKPPIKDPNTPIPCLIEHTVTGTVALVVDALREGQHCSYNPGYADLARIVLLTPIPDFGGGLQTIKPGEFHKWRVYDGYVTLTQTT